MLSNAFLAALPQDRLARLTPYLERMALIRQQTIHSEREPIQYLYFISRGLVAMVRSMSDGRMAEIGSIGTEGIVGIMALYGVQPPVWETIVQLPGEALRLRLDIFESEIEKSAALQEQMRRYLRLMIFEIGQNSACNRLHSLEKRYCRWLLEAQDRAGADTIPMTHEFLALMLGVQRSGLSLIAGMLQRAGCIRYSRGKITILNRKRLAAASCECYGSLYEQRYLLFTKP